MDIELFETIGAIVAVAAAIAYGVYCYRHQRPSEESSEGGYSGPDVNPAQFRGHEGPWSHGPP